MSWESVRRIYDDPRTLAYFSTTGLPGRDKTITKSSEMSFLGLPLARNVVVSRAPDPDLLAYYRALGLGPEQVVVTTVGDGGTLETGLAASLTPEAAGQFERIAPICPSDEAAQLAAGLGTGSIFGAQSTANFRHVLSRSFLLLECAGEVATVPAHSIERARELGAQRLFSEHDAYGGGFLVRKNYSINGDDLLVADSAADLEVGLRGVQPQEGLVVARVPREQILKDLELAFQIGQKGATLLGVVEQLIERNRHAGSRSIELDEEVLDQVNRTIGALNARLSPLGFDGAICGLDAFLTANKVTGKPELKAYDLNPCVSQAFYPLYAVEKLRVRFPGTVHFRVHFYSVFPHMSFKAFRETIPLFNPENSRDSTLRRGVVPLLFYSSKVPGTLLGRTACMALFVGQNPEQLDEDVTEFEKGLKARHKYYRLYF